MTTTSTTFESNRERRVWNGVSYEGVIKWMKKFVLAMTDVFILKAASDQKSHLQDCRANIQSAFAHNGDLIMRCFRSRMEYDETPNKSNIRSTNYLNPWSKSSTICFRNGVMQVIDKTSTRFISFDEDSNIQRAVVQCSDKSYIPMCNDDNEQSMEWWTSSFIDKANAAFAIRILASCIFREEHRFAPEHRKVVIIFENCSPRFACHLQQILRDLFAKYILQPEVSDVPFGLHTFFRFAMTNLSQSQCIRFERYDIASNLGASIPHIVFCPRAAIENVNFSGHAAPYIFDMRNTKRECTAMQANVDTDAHSKIILQQLMHVWQNEVRTSFPISLVKAIPVSLKFQQMEIVQIFAAAIRFMGEFVIYNEYNDDGGRNSVSFEQIKDAFAHNLGELVERNEVAAISKDRIRMYRSVIIDHLARCVPGLKDPWCDVHLRKQNEKKPIYHRPIGHESSQVFEKMYNMHLDELRKENKPTMSRTQFFFWCRASSTQPKA